MNFKKLLGNKTFRNFLHALIVVAIYFILFGYLSERDVVSTLLSGGNQSSKLDLAICLFFILLRFFTLVLLPGILLAMAGASVWEYIAGEKQLNTKIDG